MIIVWFFGYGIGCRQKMRSRKRWRRSESDDSKTGNSIADRRKEGIRAKFERASECYVWLSDKKFCLSVINERIFEKTDPELKAHNK